MSSQIQQLLRVLGEDVERVDAQREAAENRSKELAAQVLNLEARLSRLSAAPQTLPAAGHTPGAVWQVRDADDETHKRSPEVPQEALVMLPGILGDAELEVSSPEDDLASKRPASGMSGGPCPLTASTGSTALPPTDQAVLKPQSQSPTYRDSALGSTRGSVEAALLPPGSNVGRSSVESMMHSEDASSPRKYKSTKSIGSRFHQSNTKTSIAPCVSYEQAGAIGQFKKAHTVMAVESRRHVGLAEIVTSSRFESVSTAVNLLSALAVALDVQYRGFEMAYDLKYAGDERPANEIWPGFKQASEVIDVVFGVLFTLELLLKCVALRLNIVKSFWNWVDIVAVLGWLVEKAIQAEALMNPVTLRILRLAKMARLARRLKAIKALDSLQVLVGSIIASLSVLVWSTILLVVCQLLVGLILNSMLSDFITGDHPSDQQDEIFKYFGTFTRCMFTMFELTLGNWVPISRMLMENVSEWYGLFMLAYKMIMGFAVVKVITGVFLHETFKVASLDDELMVVQRDRTMKKQKQQMQKLFDKADKDCDGCLTKPELKRVLQDPKTKTWLSAMELEVADSDRLFDFIDDGDGFINIQELVDGVSRLKGAARSIDMVALMRKTLNLESMISELRDTVYIMQASAEADADDVCVVQNRSRNSKNSVTSAS